MQTQKIVNLLNDNDNKNSKFPTKKWYVILTVNQKIIIQTKMKLNFQQVH